MNETIPTNDTIPAQISAQLNKVITAGDLSTLTAVERVHYYLHVCRSLGLNPLTKPFDYLELEEKENGQIRKKLVLYPNQNATAQLRQIRRIDISITKCEAVDNVYVVIVGAKTPSGRTDEATGVVPLEDSYGKSLRAKAKADAMMRAETKAKRRVTLSICGLGWMDVNEESGRLLPAKVYDPPLDVLTIDPPITPMMPQPTAEIWRTWKSEDDAIAWAKAKLPHLDEKALKTLFDETPPDPSTGKKAIAWMHRVLAASEF